MTTTTTNNFIGDAIAKVLRAGVVEARKDARRFNMSHWLLRSAIMPYERMTAFLAFHRECGTTLCYGSFLLESAPEEYLEEYLSDLSALCIAQVAMRFAGLSEDQAEALFFLQSWPTEYQEAYNKAKTPEGKVDALERRVERFIRTGE